MLGLTEVLEVVAGFVESTSIELQADDCKDDDGEEKKEGNVDEGPDGLCNGGHDNLEA